MSLSCLHSLSEKQRNPILGSRGVCLFAPQDKGDETETVTCGFNFFNFLERQVNISRGIYFHGLLGN